MLDARLRVARRELILGGQRSGKSRRAESVAQSWLGASKTHNALLIATAQPGDAEMRQRIERHQADRARRLPRLHSVEEPLALAQAIAAYSAPQTLVLVDCLTLWLTNQLMPAEGLAAATDAPAPEVALAALLQALRKTSGPVVLVSNEIGLGLIPMGREVRDFVDALGQLNQAVAGVCERVTLMAAGLPLILKD
ncbi:MAG: bifunctional adenosylcobinamide kinase/adenosylcobinamide-phosphate guanylyltransferase [Rhodoferax sp.]|nr:bifunctional adenosylcobinamide kinase/adenosylcobinamide-phosphate guanylyltransferase [Rhodoferax sp.]